MSPELWPPLLCPWGLECTLSFPDNHRVSVTPSSGAGALDVIYLLAHPGPRACWYLASSSPPTTYTLFLGSSLRVDKWGWSRKWTMSCGCPGPISVCEFPIKLSKPAGWTCLPHSLAYRLLGHLGTPLHTWPFHGTWGIHWIHRVMGYVTVPIPPPQNGHSSFGRLSLWQKVAHLYLHHPTSTDLASFILMSPLKQRNMSVRKETEAWQQN